MTQTVGRPATPGVANWGADDSRSRARLAGAAAWAQTHWALLVTLALLAPPVGFGQVSFEKADVHVSTAGTRENGGFLPDGRFESRGGTMLKLISIAYGIHTDLILGGPDWLASDRFDVVAKAPTRRPSQPELLEMLRNLLAERFELSVREEQRDMPVYLLKVVKTGPKLQPSANPQAPLCPSIGADPDLHHRACQDYSMADLSKLLPLIARNYVDRQVVDDTSLDGFYDFRLDWTEKAVYQNAKSDPNAPPPVSMSDALEKLGLRLEPGMRPTQVLVVEHVNPGPGLTKSADTSAVFEVAEVRKSKSTAQQGLTALPGGELEILGYTLKDLVAMAFDVGRDRIRGEPKWLDSDRFDVIAKSPEVMSPHLMSVMLKTLIGQRFQLQTHTEDQPLPVFALVLGKDHPRLKNSQGTERSECTLRLADVGRTYLCRNTTMAQLAERLPNVAQAYLTRPLVDLTGLKDAYDFGLTWTPKNRKSDMGQIVGGVVQAPASLGDVSVFDAVDRQLGLRIEERKHPMPVLVIDRAERPQ